MDKRDFVSPIPRNSENNRKYSRGVLEDDIPELM